MATLNLSLPSGTSVCNGKQVTFTAPCSCENVTTLKINGTDYALVDTMGQEMSGQKSIWAEGSLVTVVLDADTHKAYLSVSVTKASVEEAIETAFANIARAEGVAF